MSTNMITFKTIYLCMVIFILLVMSTIPVAAQDGSPITSTNVVSSSNAGIDPVSSSTTANPTDCPTTNLPPARVTSAYREIYEDGVLLSEDDQLELGEVLTVKVENLSTLLNQATCDRKKIVLFLDERPLTSLTPYPPTEPTQALFRFTLKRSEESREVWTHLLGRPTWDPRPTKVSVGLEDQAALPSTASIKLVVIPHLWFAFWALLFVSMLIGFLALAMRSDILRDPVSPSNAEKKEASYSLARTQIAWWFFLVLGSYLFIGIITGDFTTSITGTVLGIIGISVGTAISAAVIDNNPAKANSGEQTSTSNGVPAQNTNPGQQTQGPEAPQEQEPVDENGKQSSQPQAEQPANPTVVMKSSTATPAATVAQPKDSSDHYGKKSSGQHATFLLDILRDANNSIAFHRFQIAAWTLVLGIIFISAVYKELAMPSFDESLLALLGISGGTYLGFKLTEK